jgi:(2R)-3-sulfolactate dehydrogenase (NADP+)
MPATTLSPDAARSLVIEVFEQAGMPKDLAEPAARALVDAERDGLASHGLARVPFYAAQMRTGKVVPTARPEVARDGAVIRVDAGHGLAFAAIEAGAAAAREVVREQGVAIVSIAHSHHFGVAARAVEPFARVGLIALAMANSPAAMAPWGGKRPLYGTNPIAFACPRPPSRNGAAEPLVIDLSLSRVARGKVMLAQKAKKPIPEGWALDVEGNPTTDAAAAMAGSMLPMGGAKGAALALMVELLTAGLTGSSYAYEASSLFDDQGPPPDLAHFVLVLDPARFAGDFAARAEAMFEAIEAEEGARLPGARRFAERASRAERLEIAPDLLEALQTLAGRAPKSTA